jgi:outer membrane receptor protein involved in Fe transport
MHSKLGAALLCAASVIALSSASRAQEVSESVVVTGSRVITDAANSPTPVLATSIAQLEATTPSNIPDALNKLPVFQGSSSPSTSNNAAGNAAANVLNLRNFGVQRTLVLVDGHRAAPSNSDGTVDIDTLPQGLVSRVDVITGGASAVYGSDAVTGVVNFILDKHFSGVKLNANAGISGRGDGASYQASVVGGTDLMGGRMHIEGSFKYYHADQILVNQRSYGSPANWISTGLGTAASPYVTTKFGTLNSFSFGGKIACPSVKIGTTTYPACAANGQQFVTDGVIGPFNPGTATGTPSVSAGGDGTYPTHIGMTAAVSTAESFGRLSYNLDDTTTAYINVGAAEAWDFNNWTNNYIQTGTTTPNTFFASNPYLTPTAAAALSGATTSSCNNSLNPSVQYTGCFQMTSYLRDRYFITRTRNTNMNMTVGIDGTLMKKYDWSLYYTHANNRLKTNDPTNQSAQKMYAAEDAVKNASGQIVCYVSTTSYANLYPGCTPLNPFGPTAITDDQYRYITQETGFIQTNTLDNVGGSIAGEVLENWAGPVRAALSAEMRWHSYAVTSLSPTGFVDCTGLRICNSGTSMFLGSSTAPLPEVSDNVWEFAGEVNVPLLKDLPLVQSLSTDVAGRYTNYSVSGAVETWKVGADWHVNDDLRFRATTSIDIRAPTLNDLFSPQQLGHGGFTDLHTGGIVQNALSITQGNPLLVPETARTYTAGVVLTPTFLEGVTASLDYYSIKMKNSIGSIGGNTTGVQQICEASNGTSQLCQLIVRPFAFSDHSPANYPTAILNQSLNAAVLQAEGWEMEVDYGFQLADIMDSLPGAMTLRVLGNYQPLNTSQQFVGSPVLPAPQAPKGLLTTFVGYNLGSWDFNLQYRYDSPWKRSTQPGVVFYAQPYGPAQNYFDLNISKGFNIDGNKMSLYLSIQNLFDNKPPIAPVIISVPGLYAAGLKESGNNAIKGVDVIGRYFTVGVKANLD